MILPTKGILPANALLSVGSRVLEQISEPITISHLWRELKTKSETENELTFEWFALSLDLLFILGAIDIKDGRLAKNSVSAKGIESR